MCIIDKIKAIMCLCPDKRNHLPPQRLRDSDLWTNSKNVWPLEVSLPCKTMRSTTVVHTPPSKVTLKLKLPGEGGGGLGSCPGPLSWDTSFV